VSRLHDIWAQGNVPFLSIAATPCSGGDVAYLRQIARGDIDAFLTEWANETLDFLNGQDGKWGTDDDRRVFISLNSEFNGNWNLAWSDPDGFKLMWRHVVDKFRSVIPQDKLTKTRIQFVWTANAVDVGKKVGNKNVVHKAEVYYPGNTYVDWIGLDGYNFGAYLEGGTWRQASSVFEPMIKRMRKLAPTKPFAVVETSCSTLVTKTKHDVAKKNAWIAAALTYYKSRNAKMVLWFQENKETDWEVFQTLSVHNSYFNKQMKCRGNKKLTVSGRHYIAYSAYLAEIKKSFWVGANPKNKRLISDAAFLGKQK